MEDILKQLKINCDCLINKIAKKRWALWLLNKRLPARRLSERRTSDVRLFKQKTIAEMENYSIVKEKTIGKTVSWAIV